MSLKLLKIEDITVDEELYPRNKTDYYLVSEYANSLRSGSVFPPIKVAWYNRKHVLIDGKHRIDAYLRVKRDTIQADVVKNLTKEEIFAEAVKCNTAHGSNLNSFDKITAILKLEKYGYNREEISGFVKLPMDVIERYLAKRVVRTVTGEELVLKAPLSRLSEEKKANLTAEELVGQDIIASRTFFQLIYQLIDAIDNDLFDKKDKKLIEKLRELRAKLKKY